MKAITLYIMNTGALSVYVPPGFVRSAYVSLKFTYRSLITFLGIVLVSAARNVFSSLDTLIPLSVYRPPSLVHLRGPVLDPCTTYVSHVHLLLARVVPLTLSVLPVHSCSFLAVLNAETELMEQTALHAAGNAAQFTTAIEVEEAHPSSHLATFEPSELSRSSGWVSRGGKSQRVCDPGKVSIRLTVGSVD